MRTLWTFGDSYTADYFIPHQGQYPDKNNYEKYMDWRGGTLPKVWSTLLSEKLNVNLKNLGIGGSSNYTIFNKFIESLYNINENDVLIFGWTNILRYQAANEVLNKIVDIIPNGEKLNFSQITLDEMLYNRSQPSWIKEVHSWIRLINNWCKLKNVKVFHWNADPCLFLDINEDNLIMAKSPHIDLCGYANSGEHYDGGVTVGTIYHETNGVVEDGHHGEHGHKMMCNIIYNEIKNLI